MSKRWCPDCETDRYAGEHYVHGPDCNDCGTDLEAVPRRVRAWRVAKAAPIVAILLALLIGPPIWALATHWGEPLLVYETVTTTVTRPEVRGLGPALLSSLGVPFIILLIGFAAAYGPRRL